MKKFRIEVLRRAYTIESDKSEAMIASIEKKLNKALSDLHFQMPSVDILDLLMVYTIELLTREEEYSLQRKEKAGKERLIQKKIAALKKRIEEEMARDI
ncbi:MAG: hypothetical protein WDA18_01405 [Candidatus Ratteibacteria bacterium]|jgi:cell division protein ZapA (FtsZ GTPase activity inhibitor)